MNSKEYEWKEDYDSSKFCDLEVLNLPSNYLLLTQEQKDAIDRIFYSKEEESVKGSYRDIINNLHSAISEIENSIYDLENR